MSEFTGLLNGVVKEWGRRVTSARETRKDFMRTAAICTNFFQGSNGFMWDSAFRQKFFSSLPAPDFKVTLNKAFELVAIVGPSLFWEYPGRVIKGLDDFDITAEALGDPSDPAIQQMLDAMMADRTAAKNRSKTSSSLMEKYLNYSQREQPYGGLRKQARMAITEALVTGRGVLQVEPYKFPGSDRVLTQAKYLPVSRLFIDPDCKMPDLSDCTWIAIQHVDPHWEVERKFGLETDYLRGKCSRLSQEDVAKSEFDDLTLARKFGSTHDLVIWYEVFSKCGVGTRGKSHSLPLNEAFESVVGDYAYVCFTSGLNEPLNFQESMLELGDQEIKKAFAWPTPYYMDHLWPVSLLDFYPSTTGPWPIAPMAPGIGHLIFMNVTVSALCSRVYHSSRNLVAVLKSATDDVMKKIRGGEFNEFIELNPNVNRNINELVSFLQNPPVNYDVFQILDRVGQMFDKAVGLTDTLYGLHAGGKVSRTAADANIRQEAVNVRPDDMAKCVEDWMTETANIERICAGWHVQGGGVQPLFGDVGAMLWDTLIVNGDPELFVRQMDCTVESNSIRRPNKARDNENLSRFTQYMLPALQGYAMQTGNYEPFNAFIKSMGRAMEQDTTEWMLPSMQAPPPNPQPDSDASESSGGPADIPVEEMPPELPVDDLPPSIFDQGIDPSAFLPPEAQWSPTPSFGP